jgi:hypothetical protein
MRRSKKESIPLVLVCGAGLKLHAVDAIAAVDEQYQDEDESDLCTC